MAIDTLQQALGNRVQENKNISPYLTLRTKTTAEYYFEAESRDDIQNAYKAAMQAEIPFLILGGGSNLAVTKGVLPGIVVRNLYQRKEVVRDNGESVDLLISSGYPIARLVTETAKDGYSGFEYHLGLPGTLGGGIAMNSKWYVERKPVFMGDPLIKATILNKEGDAVEVDKDYFAFRYDYSVLKDTKEVFLEGIFRLKKEDPELLKQRAKNANEFRRKTQVVGKPTCGCMFQNITDEEQKTHNLPNNSAGYLIDQVGLKNTKIGAFVVSEQHGNFIINSGEGDPKDLQDLMNLIKLKVQEKFGIELKEEVIVI